MKVWDLMIRDVRTCLPQDTLNTASRVLWEYDVGCLPVVDEVGRVVGVVTDRDVCMAAYTQGATLWSIPVSSAMSRTVVCCRAEDNHSVVEEQMRVHQVRRLPVVDKEGKLVGLIALSDLAREAARQRERKRREVSADEVVATLAAICEPRQLDLREAAQLG